MRLEPSLLSYMKPSRQAETCFMKVACVGVSLMSRRVFRFFRSYSEAVSNMNMQYLHCLTLSFIGEEGFLGDVIFIEETSRGTCGISWAEES